MMSFLKKKINVYIIFVFIFTLVFSLLIPLGGDDWGNYLYKGMSFFEDLEIAKRFYMIWEGRFFSRLFLTILVPNQVVWALINACLMSLLFYFLYKILNTSEKYLFLLLMCLLFVDFETFAQVYVWKTGNITYFFPMVYMLFLIFINRKIILDEEFTSKWCNYLLIPFTFIFCMFVENVAIGIIFVCLLNVIYFYIKNKKINIAMILCLISAIIGFCFMYFSPGTRVRMNVENDFTSLSLIEKFLYNIPNLINYTFIKNSFLVLLFIVVMVVIIKRNVKRNVPKYLLLVFTIIPAFVTLILNIGSRFVALPNVLLKVLNSQNVLVDIYWILFTILFIILIFKYLKLNKSILYFMILAIVTAGSMMLSPTWGGRTACITTFMLFIVLILCLKQLDLKIFENKKMIIFSNLICISFMILFTVYSVYIYNLNIDRNKYINYQLENRATEIEVIILPSYYTWNLNTWGSDGDFAYNFKSAYGIDRDMKLIYVSKDEASVDVKRIKASSKMKD